MSYMNFIAAEYLEALPEVRSAVKPLVGPYARLALVQILAESIVDGARFEAQVDPDVRLREALEQLHGLVTEMRSTEQRSSLTHLLLSRKYAGQLQDK